MVGAPPVVRLITQFERCLMTLRNGANASGLWSGWPVFGLRACRCTIAAPASAASTAASAISCGVTGSAFEFDGVWSARGAARGGGAGRGAGGGAAGGRGGAGGGGGRE